MGKERYTCSVQAPALGPLPYSITDSHHCLQGRWILTILQGGSGSQAEGQTPTQPLSSCGSSALGQSKAEIRRGKSGGGKGIPLIFPALNQFNGSLQ